MAEETTEKPDDGEDEVQSEEKAKPSKKNFLKRLLTPKGLVILVAVSILVHCIAFACTRATGKSASADSGEISLGDFSFNANPEEAGPIRSAWFSLHIALLEHVDSEARAKLKTREFRVKQGVEELLRRAHGGDFGDSNLGELKRLVQEQINETLGMRAIADVIITDLEITPREDDEAPPLITAEKVPWKEEPES